MSKFTMQYNISNLCTRLQCVY